jgi:hypothetical protein
MAVGDFAREFQILAAAKGIGLIPQVLMPWLSGLGHMDPVVHNAPSEVLDRLATAYLDLGGSPDAGLRRRKALMVDFVLGDNVIVELDEFQHFTSARNQTLDLYEGVEHGLDVDAYRGHCIRNMARADQYRAAKPASGFEFPGGRRAQRAYLDMVRDLLGPTYGVRVIRIPATHGIVDVAVQDLKAALNRL